MRLLLDTHVLLWWLTGAKLTRPAREAIAEPTNQVFVSPATTWELVIKASLGRLTMPADLPEVLAAQNLLPLPVTIAHTLAVGGLPPVHRDPFDRLLIAQARQEGLTLVTRDERIKAYDVPVLAA